MRFLLISIVYLLSLSGYAQKNITLQDIWSSGVLRGKGVPGFDFMKNGKDYLLIEENKLMSYDIVTNTATQTIIDGNDLKGMSGFLGEIQGYEFTPDESKILLSQDEEAIYRRSSKGNYFLYDRVTKQISKVNDGGKVSNPSISPDGSKVAFVMNNNLYYKDVKTNKTIQVTKDGMKNSVINGMCDWVYEEEFSFTKAYEWSPSGNYLAYIRFDESKVPEYFMPMYEDGAYPRNEIFKYPKVGEKNADVKVLVYDITKKKINEAPIGSLLDIYIPRIKWANNDNELVITKLNRHQNHLQLYLVDAQKKRARIMLEEKNKYYVDITDDLTFLKDGKHFIWTSEKNGYNSIYLYNMDGNEIKQLTASKYDVLQLYGVDEKRNEVFFKAAEKSPMEHDVMKVKLDGSGLTKISKLSGVNSADFSPTFDYYSITNSTLNTPPIYELNKYDGNLVKGLEYNKELVGRQKEYNVSTAEFFNFKTSEGVSLNGWMIKPKNFDSTKKYPVFMTQYSGPGSQQVLDQWDGTDYWFHQMLTQQGYIVACVDPRGTGARGEEFKKLTYLQLGKYETMDQIEAAKYLGNQPYVDNSRIGIFGWSYGGYMSSLAILKGNDIFKSAIAVAPVTNWKWYDSVYTERYMRTVKENEAGYKDNSPVYFADRLKGNYLLIHGMGDDNVHFQNTVEMAGALIKANKQFDTYFYPNKNHGIYGGNTRLHLYNKIYSFIKEKL